MSSRTDLEVADVIRQYGAGYLASREVPLGHERVLRDLLRCRTAELGGHTEACEDCGVVRNAYNSCRNRHCPKCGSTAQAKWLEARTEELLPVRYEHTVFKLPSLLHRMARQNAKIVFDLLFSVSDSAMKTVTSSHRGGRPGFFSILHTWGQEMQWHPHIHVLSPAGGLSKDGKRWHSSHGAGLPTVELTVVFRERFLAELDQLHRDGNLKLNGDLSALRSHERFARFLEKLGEAEWEVYSKPPFAGPEQALRYLSQCHQGAAISNNRIAAIADGRVTFTCRERNRPGRQRQVTLDADEFLRRFLLHVLPSGYQRIRHYGFLANRGRAKNLASIRKILKVEAKPEPTSTTAKLLVRPLCTTCRSDRHVRLGRIPRENTGHLDELLHSQPPPPLTPSSFPDRRPSL